MPSYEASPEYNAEILRRCIPLMIKNQVTPHPINYAIWYEYVVGNNVRLNAAIDRLIKNKKVFDDTVSLELYSNFVCNASVESFEKINSDLQELLEGTSVTVMDAQHKVSSAEDNFIVSSLQLEKIDDLSDVKSVLNDVVAETKQLLEVSQGLKVKLNEANEEMTLLRSELSKVREMASTDALTGLLNRRAFDNEMNELVLHSVNSAHCLMIMDLDHFKKINDNFGHLVGDKVIRYTAGLLKKHVLEHHHAARYGGEEMAVIMPDTELKTAVNIAETIRESLGKSQLKQKDNGESIGRVTISVGVTSMQKNDTVESFISRADNAMYSAKKNGRNKVVHH